MWDTITSTCSSAEVANLMKKAKVSIKNEVHNTLHNDWAEKCEESEQNILRSVNLCYNHDVMGKRKYISIRKGPLILNLMVREYQIIPLTIL